MSKVAIVGAVVIIGVGVVGGGYYYASHKADQELHNTISLIEKSMPGTSIKYETYSVSPFSQTATLQKVVVKDSKGQEYTADTLTVGGVANDKVGNVAVDKFHTSINGGSIDVNHIDAKNVVVPTGAIVLEDGKIKKIFPSKVSFDLLSLQNVSAIGPDKTGGTIGQYEIKNYGLKQNSDQTLKQLEIKASKDSKENLKLDQLQINGLDLASIIELAEQGKTPKAVVGQPSKAVIEGFSAHLEGQDFGIAKFETENSVAENGDMKTAATFSGFTFGTGHNVQLYAFQEMGYDKLDLSGNLSGQYNKAKQEWSVSPFNLTIKDMGNLNATFKFNAPADLNNVDPQQLLSSYKLISLKVVLKDQGLLTKIFEAAAKKKDQSVEQVKTDIVNLIKKDAETATIPVQKQGDEAVLQLINDPKQSLVIEANPDAPITAMELMGKSQPEIFDALKLNIKAEAGK